MKRYIKSKTNNTINISGWLKDEFFDEPTCSSAHWEAIAEFDDGTRLEFTRPCTVRSYADVEEQQYNIECELLDKAVDTGKEIVFYTVNFVCDD